MTFDTMVGVVAEHWVLIVLVMCPVVIVMMALAALGCEACGAPFGIFRRRNRTIDLCLRCALLHDYRRANPKRETPAAGESQPATSSGADAAPPAQSRSESRIYNTQSPVELGVVGHPGAS